VAAERGGLIKKERKQSSAAFIKAFRYTCRAAEIKRWRNEFDLLVRGVHKKLDT